MELFKNKKGDAGGTGQQQLFYLAEIIVGAILISSGIYLTIDLTGSTDTQVISKDISVLLNTITHQPNNLAYTYALPESTTQLKITEDKLILYSKKGSTTQQLKIKQGIKLEPITLLKPDELPIFFSPNDGVIRFEEGDKTTCTNLRLLDEDKQYKITISGTNKEKETLRTLKDFMEIDGISEEIFSEEHKNTELELKFGEQNNFTMIMPMQEEYEAINCYAKTMFGNEDKISKPIIKQENQDKIIIEIGNYEDLTKLDPDELNNLLITYSNKITQTIMRGKAS